MPLPRKTVPIALTNRSQDQMADISQISLPAPPARRSGFRAAMTRYGISAGGTVAASGANFLTLMIFLHFLPREDFGLFSFVMVVISLCLSIAWSLLAPSMMASLLRTGEIDDCACSIHMKVNLAIAASVCAAVLSVCLANHASLPVAAGFGLYAALLILRNLGRIYAYATKTPLRALSSDLTYAAVLTGTVITLAPHRELTLEHAAFALAISAALGFLAFGLSYVRKQFWPGAAGSIASYGRLWLDFSRWSTFSAFLTEFTVNTSAYAVTFISGPKAFAVLALGSLLMRPASLVLSALPDIERPRMAVKIGRGDVVGGFRTVKNFAVAAGVMWIVTVLIGSAVLIWFPQLILKRGYDSAEAWGVFGFWVGIIFLRTLRIPYGTLLEAAGEFRAISYINLWACITSLIITPLLLLLGGPIVSLGGTLAGDLVMAVRYFSITRKWKRAISSQA